ncbi:MAG: sulfurtransferase [Desulfomonile tiedjei]|nr:sulfurtransferase [Desulfomonile tiedjei]
METKQHIGAAPIILVALFFCHILVSSAPAIENGGYSNGDLLVTTQWVADHLNDPNVRILDRQDVEPGEEFYSKGHIPNAIRMPTDAIKGMRLGIQEMLVVKDLIRFLEENGISPDHHVVLVSRSDRFPAATRVFWALELLGHKKTSVLDGGIDKWAAEKRPMTSEVPLFDRTSYKVNLKRDRLMTGDELAGYVGSFKELGIVVVDSRRPDEYSGAKMSRASDKLGRIPDANNVFFMKILTGETFKEFKAAEEIKKTFASEGITPDKNAIFSCVSGCFGTVLYFGARLLDFPKAAVYDGGWIEWSRKDYPVEAGSSSGGAGAVQEPPVKAAPPSSAPRVPQQGC